MVILELKGLAHVARYSDEVLGRPYSARTMSLEACARHLELIEKQHKAEVLRTYNEAFRRGQEERL